MSFTIPLRRLGKSDVPSAGGKGANLGEITNAGFSVPAGFTLVTEAYNKFVEQHDLRQRILNLASQVSADTPQSSDEASAAIEILFLEAELSEALRAELISSYSALTPDGEATVSVRSSATAEDLPQASFAGQHKTFLNVRGSEALLEAVKACWASLWSSQALAYRERMGIDHNAAAMAVVVQTMVLADASGILFTANPTSGARDELVINASFGLGEAIVSGQVTPDTFILNRQNLTVKETIIGSKEAMIVPATGQGIDFQAVPVARRDQAAIANTLLMELGELGIRLEKHFDGVPQDIEWAVLGGRCWLLQARPITNLPPPPLLDVRWDPPRPNTIWMRRQIVEHMPEPLSPLFDELYLQGGLDQSMQELAGYIGDLAGFEIDVWDFVEPPFAATVNGYAYSIASFNFSWKLIPTIIRMYTIVLPKMIQYMIPYWQHKALPAYLADIDRWKSIDLANATDEELLQGVHELAIEDAVYWFAAAVPLGIARVTDAALDRFLKSVTKGRRLADGSRPTSGHYLRGFPSKTLDAQGQLEVIAGLVRNSDTLSEEVASTPAARLPKLLANDPAGERAMNELQQYLDEYGHQIYNLDFAVPTQADDPLPVLLSLKAAVTHPERDAQAHQMQLAQEREELVAATLRSLNPVQRQIFRRLLDWAQRYGPNRELALFYVGAAWPTLRWLALELGWRLTEAGSLEDPIDVFYLQSAELAAASKARSAGSGRPELAELARERRVLREARKRLEPPNSVPPDGRFKFGPIDMAMFEPKSRDDTTGPVLTGFAVSPGRLTAPASIIRSPEDFDKMVPDTILVCRTTTPAWTPLFAQAKGLVTDIGGALAHGSIVAREYGIPAVMGTGAATQRIKNGQRIYLDGDNGIVRLLGENETGEEWLALSEAPSSPLVSKKKLAALAAVAVGLVIWWQRRKRGNGR
jgi:pyruvate,water dikinase